jgi:hypothetical protein
MLVMTLASVASRPLSFCTCSFSPSSVEVMSAKATARTSGAAGETSRSPTNKALPVGDPAASEASLEKS